jgi:hypothetical protein
VVPYSRGFLPFKGLSSSGSSGIVGTPKSLRDFVDSARNVNSFAADNSEIYKFNSATEVWDAVGRVANYSVPADHLAYMVQFGDNVIYCNGFDDLQKYEMGVDSVFSDISGASGLAPYTIDVVGDFLIAGPMRESGTDISYRVRWSPFADPTGDWTPSDQTQAGLQDIADVGKVIRVVGGDFGTILCENGVVRMDYVGPPLKFSFRQIEGAPGCLVAGSVLRTSGKIYYLSPDGFQMFDGARSYDIGAEKVDIFFNKFLQRSSVNRISVASTSDEHSIYWSFPGPGSSDGKPNYIIAYNYVTNQWGLINIEIDFLGTFAAPSKNLDQISGSIDSLPASLDSDLWRGGTRLLAAVNGSSSYLFDGDNLDAVIRAPEIGGLGGSIIRGFVPLVEGSCTITGRSGSRNSPDENIVWGSSRPRQVNKIIPLRERGRYVSLEMTITGNDWDRVFGMDVDMRRGGGNR